MSYISLVFMLIVCAVVYLKRGSIVSLFTTEPSVHELSNSCVYLIVLLFVPDFIQGSLQGVIRALNVQKIASFISLASFYLITIPVSFVLVFVCDMRIRGLWIGTVIGVFLNAVMFTRLVFKTDWQVVADVA